MGVTYALLSIRIMLQEGENDLEVEVFSMTMSGTALIPTCRMSLGPVNGRLSK